MSLAYVVLAHRKPEQVLRLVRRLATPRTTFRVHVDRRSPQVVHDRIAEGLRGVDRVRHLTPVPCYWGGFGVVRAALAAIDELEGVEYDHAVLLTGQDYPIKPVAEIEAFFDDARGRSFIDCARLPSPRWQQGGLSRLDRRYWHGELLGRRFHVPNRLLPLRVPRRLPQGLVPHMGGAYWALGREAVDYVREFNRSRPDVARFFEHVDMPDESYFQTVLASSGLEVVDGDLHYIDWSEGLTSPRVLTARDLPALAATPALFARKFDIEVDAAVLDRLDES